MFAKICIFWNVSRIKEKLNGIRVLDFILVICLMTSHSRRTFVISSLPVKVVAVWPTATYPDFF